MPRNVEIKAKVHNLLQLVKNAKHVSKENGVVLQQKDTFYVCGNGRLKLRSVTTKEEGCKSELIFYRRPDEDGPKVSSFVITPVQDYNAMDGILTRALGSEGTVAKTRTLFMVGQTRVHVDSVEGLGDFMELEVQLTETQTLEEGSVIAEDLMNKLGIGQADLVTGAYHDMLKRKKALPC